jgi:hypothetical protein
MPLSLRGPTVIAGDLRPGKRLLALAVPPGSTGNFGDRPNTTAGMALVELRP